MKRTSIIVAVLILLTLPMAAGADDQGWMPPEWTPTPPARQTIDFVQMARMLRAKGVLTDEEYSQVTHAPLPPLAQQGRGRVWTWDEIEHNPVRSTGGD
jgi:hypothetical protein